VLLRLDRAVRSPHPPVPPAGHDISLEHDTDSLQYMYWRPCCPCGWAGYLHATPASARLAGDGHLALYPAE